MKKKYNKKHRMCGKFKLKKMQEAGHSVQISKKTKFWLSFLPALLFCFMLFFWGATETVINNEQGLAITFGDVFLPLLVTTVTTTILMLALLFVMPTKIYGYIVSLVFSLSVASYLQVAFMNGSIGRLGMVGEMPSRGGEIVNLSVWLFIILGITALWVIGRTQWKKAVIFGSAVLLLMQFVSLTTLLPRVESWERSGRTGYILSIEDELVLSSDENTIVFVLDALSGRQLEEALYEFPHLADFFRDFTRFNNSANSYGGTFPGIAYLLTRENFDPTIPSAEFLSRAWESERVYNFYNSLHDANYRFRLLAIPDWFTDTVHRLDGIADNFSYSYFGRVQNSRIIAEMVNLAVFRYSPIMIKNRFQPSDGSFSNVLADSMMYTFDDLRIYEQLNNVGLTTQDEYNMLVFIHMIGTHSSGQPFNQYLVDTPGVMIPQHVQAAGVLRIVSEYIRQMQMLGIYDDANIIIMADHGWKREADSGFMIRKAGVSQDAIIVSDAPISHTDFWPTLIGLMGLNGSYFGPSVFDIEEEIPRERVITYFTWHPDLPNPDMTYNAIIRQTFTTHVLDESIGLHAFLDFPHRMPEGFVPPPDMEIILLNYFLY